MAVSKKPARRIVPVVDDEAVEAEEVAEDEEDEAPKAKSKRATPDDNGETALRGGWTEGQKQMDSTSSFAQTLKLEEKSVIMAFLDDVPYVNFRRHWIERSTKEGKTTRAYSCPESINKPCPLCEIGDRPQAVAAFNVAVIGDDGQLLVRSWDCGPRLFNVLKAYANDPKISPLTKGFFVASKTGKKGTVQHNVSPVSRTALREDYDMEPPSKEDLAALKKYTPDIIEMPKASTLRELAEELADEY